ncbi:MAG TPA: zinc-binding alcohol dehydrogenase family protein [Jiangellaceae bacterium]
MSAIVSFDGLPIDDPRSLVDDTVDVPQLRPRDVLVRVEAVSVNPVDVKRRAGHTSASGALVLGYDAAGTVVARGPDVTTVAVGDEVYYAGDITRPGTNAEFHAVDERLAARKPASLGFAEAAALPLTAITAWESLFDRFALSEASTGTLLVLTGAGGVGSIMIQLARQLTGVRVLASASRDESRAWAVRMGAHDVVDHHDLVATTARAAPDGLDYLFTSYSRGNIPAFAEIVRPFGHITAIDDAALDLYPLKSKSIAWHWELMFTRSMYETPDMIEQKRLLERVAELVDEKAITTTMTTAIADFSAAGLRRAHELVESGRTVGKVVVHR